MTRKEKIYAFINIDSYIPLKEDELAIVLDVSKEERNELTNILYELIDEGKIMQTKKGKYMSTKIAGLIVGLYIGNERGFGFVSQETGDDIYINNSSTGGAMNGDRVLVRLLPINEGKRREGEIVKILEHANKNVICMFYKTFKKAYAIPDNKKLWQNIQINKEHTLGAEKGQKVVIEITKYPKGNGDALGNVVEILGWATDPAVVMRALIKSYNLPESFPSKVLTEAANIPDAISEGEIVGRRDLRNELIMTIDGEDARDLDDAVTVEIMDNGNYKLGVYIADVSHYIKPGSELEKEAVERGTSVYLTGGVIPMLPQRLSNGICSLNPMQDRLTLCLDMEISPKGEIVGHDIFNGIIRSTYRMTYTNVTKILEDDVELCKEYSAILPMLKNMEILALKLKSRRIKEGSIDFNFPETKLVYDDAGKVVDIYKYNYTISNSIIEEFMLAANRTIAEHFFWLNAPFVYRVHENPDEEKLMSLTKLLRIFNVSTKGLGQNLQPKAFAQILEQIKDKPYEKIIGNVLLRSMMKARYAPSNLGHFGLSAKYYCHFTSPIRRLADLAVHRVVKEYLKGDVNEAKFSKLKKFAEIVSTSASDREVIAEEAERSSKKLKIAEYMAQFVGQEFDAIISGIMPFGFFVELPNSVEGLVKVADLTNDYYNYIEDAYCLKGERTGMVFNIGDSIKVVLQRADKINGELDFEPIL